MSTPVLMSFPVREQGNISNPRLKWSAIKRIIDSLERTLLTLIKMDTARDAQSMLRCEIRSLRSAWNECQMI